MVDKNVLIHNDLVSVQLSKRITSIDESVTLSSQFINVDGCFDFMDREISFRNGCERVLVFEEFLSFILV